MAIQDLRVRLDSREGQEPRKLAMPERMERLGRLKASLTGLTLDVLLEPSHALLDRVVSMAEEQSIYYLELSLRTSRETEVNMLKKEPALEFSVDGSIRLSKKHPEASADTAGELRVHMCACTLDTLISKLFSLLTRRPISGYRSVTLAQIINADQALAESSTRDERTGPNLWGPQAGGQGYHGEHGLCGSDLSPSSLERLSIFEDHSGRQGDF